MSNLHLQRPVLHDLGNIEIGSLANAIPQIARNTVPEQTLLEVDAYTLEERLLSHKVGQHAKHLMI